MNVQTIGKRLFQRRNFRDMGQDTQLDLAIIKRDQNFTFFRNKRLADTPPFFSAHRYILQVRIG